MPGGGECGLLALALVLASALVVVQLPEAAAWGPPLDPRWGCRRAAPLRAGPVDKAMWDAYDRLADRVMERLAAVPPGEQWWCALAGSPGSGKSTLADAVARRVEARGAPSVVLPMDGYHFSREELRRLDPPDAPVYLPRRGAPFTFDAEGFVADLTSARAQRRASLPVYCREASDPVPGGALLEPHHRAVFVEGNYLLLGTLVCAEEDDVAREARRWQPLLPLFDETWSVSPAGGVPELRRRLIARHLETWTDAKTALFDAKTPEEGAAKRTDSNDILNAALVQRTLANADHTIISVV